MCFTGDKQNKLLAAINIAGNTFFVVNKEWCTVLVMLREGVADINPGKYLVAGVCIAVWHSFDQCLARFFCATIDLIFKELE